ncbi:YtcA family lipoprotein [Paraburkholderia xenovorans]|uniref:YtcA family lipoprotein n=1 Tax=Paraburkholderia xenovorans TaxID=36873 RepID=UPI0038BC0DCA
MPAIHSGSRTRALCGARTFRRAFEPLRTGPARRCEAALGLLLVVLLSACTGAPSVGVLGAYFPDWLFCIVGGAVLTALVHVLAYRTGYGGWLTPPALVYPALTVLFSIVLWAIGFNL